MADVTTHETRLVESFMPPSLRLAMGAASRPPEGDMALIWVDIVGSTGIAGRLVESGPAGAEALAGLLTRHFDRLLDLLSRHGGEPLMFAGDALLAGWHCADEGPGSAVARAVACGQTILVAPAGTPDATSVSGDRLQLHVAIAVGARRTTAIGPGRNVLTVTVGGGLADLQATTRTKLPEEILLSDAARAALGEDAEAVRAGPNAFRLVALLRAPPPVPLSIPPVPADALQRVTTHVPLPLASRLDRGLLDWGAELRRVTVVFVGIPDLDHSSPGVLRTLETVAETVGPLVRRHDGYVHQLRVDESGANMVIYFGIPPVAHPDDPSRAVRCTMDIRDALRRGGLRACFGVATGRVVCGIVGNDLFRAFAIFGNPVYLAARLQAAGPGMIQCDDATMRGAGDGVAFLPVGRKQLRGVAPPVAVWTPRRQEHADAPLPMYGRTDELDTLLAALRRAETEPAPGGRLPLLLIEAEAGMGKSRLIAELQAQAAADGVVVFSGYADRIERQVPFRVWRGVLERVLGLDTAASGVDERAALLDNLGPALAPRAALLNAILPLDLPETAETQSLTPQRRIPLLQEMLLALLRRAAGANRLLVTLDDAHWADEQSWAFAEIAAREVAGLVLVVGMQPLEDDAWPDALTAAGARRLRLKELSEAEQDALVMARLGTERLAPDLAALMRARTRGHPFFCLELARALLEEGLIEVVDGTCRIARHVDAARLLLPDTVQAMTIRRLDQLEPDSQVTLKVASAAGLRFPSQLVAEIHPLLKTAPEVVSGHLSQHHRIGFLEPDLIEERDGYAFRHGILRDVTYVLMLYAQRRQLHRAIADWYERVFVDDRSRLYVLLAHHLEAAGEAEQAASYLLLEAERLFRAGLVRQSVEVGLTGARLLGADLPVGGTELRAAVGVELERINELLGDRAPQELVSLPPLVNTTAGHLIRLLLALAPFAFQFEQELFALMVCSSLRLTLEYGNGPFAADVYGMYSIIFGAMSGDRVMAVGWSRLSLTMQGTARGASFSRCAFIHIWFHSHWVSSLDAGMDLALAGGEAGLGDREIIYGCFNLAGFVVLQAAAGRPLPEVMDACRRHLSTTSGQVLNSAYHLILELQFAKAMAGLTAGPLCLGDAEYDETADIASIMESNLGNQIGYYLVTMTRLHLHDQDWPGALRFAERARAALPFFLGQTAEFELAQYRGLAALSLAAFDTGAERAVRGPVTLDREGLIQDGWDCMEQLRLWSGPNPNLFGHKAELLDGLLHAARGSAAEAVERLRRAADGALRGRFLQDAGLAQEYLARVLRRAGDEAGAAEAAEQARRLFADWGAVSKLALIDREFPAT
ncbi:MAG: AAA family ATPase [Proteobacteria bacterium]|nr:AAA family ATPase [Pseudomonadota bacterium]